MDRLVSMQAFTRVVDVGSFAGAAESLNLPKATLTRLIQKLETHLAVKLLHDGGLTWVLARAALGRRRRRIGSNRVKRWELGAHARAGG